LGTNFVGASQNLLHQHDKRLNVEMEVSPHKSHLATFKRQNLLSRFAYVIGRNILSLQDDRNSRRRKEWEKGGGGGHSGRYKTATALTIPDVLETASNTRPR
jgi:hypothetical protein